jgi:hypothetical protein
MPKRKRKKAVSKRFLAELEHKIVTQRKRALRPTVAVNTQARVSETLVERRRKLEKRSRQRRDWENS